MVRTEHKYIYSRITIISKDKLGIGIPKDQKKDFPKGTWVKVTKTDPITEV